MALKILCNDFNINLENEYENERVIAILKKQREDEMNIKKKVERWFLDTFKTLCKEYQLNNKIIKLLTEKGYTEALKVLYLKDIKLDMLLDEFINADENKKEKLYLGRREIESEL